LPALLVGLVEDVAVLDEPSAQAQRQIQPQAVVFAHRSGLASSDAP
jgi:hypothetical protein